MILKRVYEYDDDGNPSDIKHVVIIQSSNQWRPSKRVINKGIDEGWLSIENGKVILKTNKGDACYWIVREPGCYDKRFSTVRYKNSLHAMRTILADRYGVPEDDLTHDADSLRKAWHEKVKSEEYQVLKHYELIQEKQHG